MNKKIKRFLAVMGIFMLMLIYALLLIFALLDISGWQRLFFAAMGLTVIIPIFLWINFWLYSRMTSGRKDLQGGQEYGHDKPDKKGSVTSDTENV